MIKITSSAAILVLAAAPAVAEDVRAFLKDGLTIQVIAKDAEFDEERSYQVVAGNQLRTFSRLEVNRDGLVTDAWLTDLDRDGAFEIVVATTQLGANAVGAVDIHEWHDYRFDTTVPAPLAASEQSGYRGNDQFSVENGRLLRAFPLFTGDGDDAVPSGKMARFEYQPATTRWLRKTR